MVKCRCKRIQKSRHTTCLYYFKASNTENLTIHISWKTAQWSINNSDMDGHLQQNIKETLKWYETIIVSVHLYVWWVWTKTMEILDHPWNWGHWLCFFLLPDLKIWKDVAICSQVPCEIFIKNKKWSISFYFTFCKGLFINTLVGWAGQLKIVAIKLFDPPFQAAKTFWTPLNKC